MIMHTTGPFNITVGDDPEHEDLTAEICFGIDCVATISQDAGLDAAMIELQASPTGDSWTFVLSDFLVAIEDAKSRLRQLERK